MLEDSTTSSSHPVLTAAAHEQPNGIPTSDNGRPSGDDDISGGPAAEGQAHAAFSSAFASFSEVRKGLYELCLAQLAGVRTRDGGHRDGDGFASGLPERSAGTRTVEGCGRASPLPGTGEDESGGGVEAREGIDGRRVLAEGDEWAVREFRRVGASVKAVRVVCRVSLLSVSEAEMAMVMVVMVVV